MMYVFCSAAVPILFVCVCMHIWTRVGYHSIFTHNLTYEAIRLEIG